MMKTQETNKLIAEFMGLKPIKMTTKCGRCHTELKVGDNIRYSKNYDAYCDNGKCSEDISTIGSTCMEACWFDGDENVIDQDTLHYHTSWDWLMPVVEKIFSLGYDYTIKPRQMIIKERMGRDTTFRIGQGESQLEVVYQAVVQFIEYYNQNK